MRPALLWLTLAFSPTIADDTPPPGFRVALEVTTRDDDARERVTKYLRNELRGLGDVAVTAEDPDYKLYVVLTEMRAGGGRIAYVLTISATSFFPDGYFDTILRTDLANTDEVLQRLQEVPVYEHQFVSLAGPTEAHLIETVTSSIINLNTYLLEPRRVDRGANAVGERPTDR
jgi:hypothetical protein